MTAANQHLSHASIQNPEQPVQAPCPTNQQVGPALDTLTVKALLALPLTAVSSAEPYRFCPWPDCPTVYYRADGQQAFSETDLREHVYQKHADDPNSLICYCFGYTVRDIRAEIEQTGRSRIPSQIMAGIQADQCACDIRNPQGRCCLGNVNRLIDHLMDMYSHAQAQDV